MVEMRVHDVMMRVRHGTRWPSPGTHQTVLLRDADGQRVIPIQFGPGMATGDLLALQLIEKSPSSALTYDLMARVLQVGELALNQVILTRDEHGMYTAVLVVLQRDGTAQTLDAGPGDALNLALRCDAPVFVEEALWTRESIATEEVAWRLESMYRQRIHTDELGAVEWRSMVTRDWLAK